MKPNTFLARAKTAVTASPNFNQMKDDGCDEKIITAFKHIAQHTKMVYAQFDDGANMAQAEVAPNSDSSFEYGAKVFSMPEFMEIAKGLEMISKAGNAEVEVHFGQDPHKPTLTIAVGIAD